jgi:DDE family transposase/transposase-like protein DUF772
MLMLWAHHLGKQIFHDYSSKFSRHDFTRPQLFACLVLREHQKESYRGVEALLRDSPQWCAAIGMKGVPDHNTLCRAAARLLRGGRVRRLLDRQARWAAQMRLLGLSVRPLALDSSMYESRHVSRHYERRRRQSSTSTSSSSSTAPSRTPRPIWRKLTTVQRLPKLAVSVDTRSHLVLATWVGTGMGSDSPHFQRLLFDAWRRVPHRRFKVVADGGYDAEHNHELARSDMRLQSIMPATIGRRPASDDRIRTRWRRRMRKLLKTKRSRRRCGYTQRWQVETVNSMIKRNLGSALRGRTDASRRRDLQLKVIVHNLMIFRRSGRVETQQSCPLYFCPDLQTALAEGTQRQTRSARPSVPAHFLPR